jgi:hypothetical protein
MSAKGHQQTSVWRGDEAKHGGLDSREPKVPISKPRDMYEPDLHIDTLKIRARNFRWRPFRQRIARFRYRTTNSPS